MDTMEQVDFGAAVGAAALDVVRERGIPVQQDAIDAMLERVREHEAQVYQEISEGRATLETIQHAAFEQLMLAEPAKIRTKNTMGIESEVTVIDRDAVLTSFAKKCFWIPWC
ncbi:MAG: hypothetical protein ABI186_07130 [Candidatus Elarobacter sp.]